LLCIRLFLICVRACFSCVCCAVLCFSLLWWCGASVRRCWSRLSGVSRSLWLYISHLISSTYFKERFFLAFVECVRLSFSDIIYVFLPFSLVSVLLSVVCVCAFNMRCFHCFFVCFCFCFRLFLLLLLFAHSLIIINYPKRESIFSFSSCCTIHSIHSMSRICAHNNYFICTYLPSFDCFSLLLFYNMSRPKFTSPFFFFFFHVLLLLIHTFEFQPHKSRKNPSTFFFALFLRLFGVALFGSAFKLTCFSGFWLFLFPPVFEWTLFFALVWYTAINTHRECRGVILSGFDL